MFKRPGNGYLQKHIIYNTLNHSMDECYGTKLYTITKSSNWLLIH